MVKFKDISRPMSVFQVLFKANFIFKDFSRQTCIFKYFSSLCEPCTISISTNLCFTKGAFTVLQESVIPRKRVLFLRRRPRFSVLRKRHDLDILRSRKEPGLWTIQSRFKTHTLCNIIILSVISNNN